MIPHCFSDFFLTDNKIYMQIQRVTKYSLYNLEEDQSVCGIKELKGHCGT